MDETEYAARIAAVRGRFARRLAGQIRDTSDALAGLAGPGTDATLKVAEAYRAFHTICGLSATIGLDAVARPATAIDLLLSKAFRGDRSLDPAEADELGRHLRELSAAALAENLIQPDEVKAA